MRIGIYAPCNNLGCLGFGIGKIYIDFFKVPYFGMFIRICNHRFYVNFTDLTFHKVR